MTGNWKKYIGLFWNIDRFSEFSSGDKKIELTCWGLANLMKLQNSCTMLKWPQIVSPYSKYLITWKVVNLLLKQWTQYCHYVWEIRQHENHCGMNLFKRGTITIQGSLLLFYLTSYNHWLLIRILVSCWVASFLWKLLPLSETFCRKSASNIHLPDV